MSAATTQSTLGRDHVGLGLLFLPAIGWLWLVGLTIAGLLGFAVRRHHFEAAGIAFGVGVILFALLLWRRMAAGPSYRDLPPLGSGAWRVAGVPFVVALVTFGWSIGLGPLSDDFVLREWARTGNWMPQEWPHLRPLPLALWKLAGAIGGSWGVLHAINVFVHALNSGLVAGLAAGWLGRGAGLVAGLLFALFPTGTEAVAWTAGVFDVVATLFVLLSAYVWGRWRPSPQRTLVLIVCCVGGLLSKESAVVIPALLALISVATALGQRGELHRQARGWSLTAVTICGLLVARMLWSTSLVSHLGNLPEDRRQLKDLIVRPFAALAVPMRSDADVTIEMYVIGLAVLLAFGMLLLRIWARHGAPPMRGGCGQFVALIVGVGWVAISALPLLLQFFVSPTLEGSRYLYLPSAGFVVALSAVFVGGRRDRVLAAAVLAVLLPFYVTALRSERRIWQEAAETRDAVLEQATSIVRAVPCSTITILDAPDNARGAFVFRVGLSEAVSGLPYTPDGESCVVRWDGAAFVRLAPEPAE